MHFEMAALARGVAPQAALQWWSDFQEGRADHGFVRGQRRRILERERGRVVMEDEVRALGVRLFRERTSASILPDRIEFEGENGVCRFSGAYVFEPRGDGTRVRLVADLHLKRALAPTRVLAAPVARAILKADLRGHVREMTRAIAGP